MTSAHLNGFTPDDYSSEAVQASPFLLKPGNLESFGNRGIELPTGLRRRVREHVTKLLNGAPLIDQAGIALRQGKLEEAQALYEKCIALATDKSDPRFFGVYWSLGNIRKMQGQHHQAIDLFKRAIVDFPGQYRPNHVLDIEESMNAAGMSDTDRAAIVQIGMNALEAAGKDIEKPREVFRGLETKPFAGELNIGRQRHNRYIG